MNRTERARHQGIQEFLEAVRDARFSRGVACPRCGDGRVQRWSSFSGRQRYRCRSCKRTFSDLTGTPAAYLKKVELLNAHAQCMAATLSVRRTAAELGIHPATAFCWRHRFLGGLGRVQKDKLAGWIEVGSEWFPHSRKGERFTDRPPRHRGPRYRGWYYGRCATVLVACDRMGHLAAAVLDEPNVSGRTAALADLLSGRVDGAPVLTARDAHTGPCMSLARRNRWGFELAMPARIVDPQPWPAHVRTARSYTLRFRRWLTRFRGVATRYLPSYVSWHYAVDARGRLGMEAAVLRWPVGAGFG